MSNEVDIIEDDLLALDKDIFTFLLKDHSRSHYFEKHNDGVPEDESKQCNIHWMTHDYEERGDGYRYDDPIKSECISGTHEKSRILMPRVLKDRQAQTKRTRDMAEVFTPSWICNKQNNLIDEAWFGRKDVFNHENEDNTWTPTEGKISFPDTKGKTWQDYVAEHVLEVTCGEAPYLVSRYDTTTDLSMDKLGFVSKSSNFKDVVTQERFELGKSIKNPYTIPTHVISHENEAIFVYIGHMSYGNFLQIKQISFEYSQSPKRYMACGNKQIKDSIYSSIQ